ncbi:MAG: hypothetical protein EP330_13915 [Deltaproteobacteria bacterium]|nr:MAG: hypothetical protein EP330_13915 [Deltaproteobacteria bacterium]
MRAWRPGLGLLVLGLIAGNVAEAGSRKGKARYYLKDGSESWALGCALGTDMGFESPLFRKIIAAFAASESYEEVHTFWLHKREYLPPDIEATVREGLARHADEKWAELVQPHIKDGNAAMAAVAAWEVAGGLPEGHPLRDEWKTLQATAIALHTERRDNAGGPLSARFHEHVLHALEHDGYGPEGGVGEGARPVKSGKSYGRGARWRFLDLDNEVATDLKYATDSFLDDHGGGPEIVVELDFPGARLTQRVLTESTDVMVEEWVETGEYESVQIEEVVQRTRERVTQSESCISWNTAGDCTSYTTVADTYEEPYLTTERRTVQRPVYEKVQRVEQVHEHTLVSTLDVSGTIRLELPDGGQAELPFRHHHDATRSGASDSQRRTLSESQLERAAEEVAQTIDEAVQGALSAWRAQTAAGGGGDAEGRREEELLMSYRAAPERAKPLYGIEGSSKAAYGRRMQKWLEGDVLSLRRPDWERYGDHATPLKCPDRNWMRTGW